MPRLTAPAPRRSRAGFSLPELLVAATLLVLVCAALGTLLVSQQRMFNRARGATRLQRDLRTGLALLPMDLRGASRAGGDLTALQDTAVQLRATIGSSIICNRPSSGVIELPPLNAARNTLTQWYAQPAVGDTVLVYDEMTSPGPEDDLWLPFRITAVATTTTACTGAPFTDPALDPPASKPRWRITLAVTPAATVVVGAPVRFLRSVRYSLYKPGTDPNNWYLGYRELLQGVWSTTEPITGPFEAPAGARSGIRFTYLDTLGQTLATPTAASVGRIDLSFRARSLVRGGTRDSVVLGDSIAVRVALRNRL